MGRHVNVAVATVRRSEVEPHRDACRSAISNYDHTASFPWVADVTALIPSILPVPLPAQYRGCEVRRRIDLGLLLALACAIIVAHATPSVAADDAPVAPAQTAETRQAGPEAPPPTPIRVCEALAAAAAANDL